MKFAIYGILLVLFVFVFHAIFIMVDYGYNNPVNGGFTLMRDKLNESMSPSYRSSSYNQSKMLSQFFGAGRFIILAIAVGCFVVEALDNPKING